MRDGPSPKEVDASRVYTDTGTITDVCSAADLPEVEILSLIEERLPQYTLRADSVYSYRHTDWLQTPAPSSDSGSDLSPEQAEETLKYMRKNLAQFCNTSRGCQHTFPTEIFPSWRRIVHVPRIIHPL